MRCRSDPMKMADLATRFSWDAKTSTLNHDQEDIQEAEEEEEEEEEENNEVVVVSEEEEECDQGNKNEVFEQESNEEEEEVSDEAKMEMEQVAAAEEDIVNGGEELVIISSIDEKMVDEEEEKEIEELQQQILQMFSQEEEDEEEEEVESNMSSFEHLLDQENPDHYQETNCPIDQHEEEEEEEEERQDNSNLCHLSPSTESDEEINEEAEESMNMSDKVSILEIINDGQEHQIELEPAQITTHSTENGVQEQDEEEEEEEQVTVILPKESEMVENRKSEEPVSTIEEEEEPKKKVLPECLLLMMCEPKLSMEVSKETWVCSTDFVRWLPDRPRKPAKSAKSGGGCDHAPPPKRRLSIDSKLKPAHAPPSVAESGCRYQHYQPPRSSCSLPAAAAAASMATMIEQKLVNAVGYEPFVLTRCKSEPMRSAAAKLIPESCFWKNAVTKLEPHGRAALGVGAAGVGF
ncbi:hypothetical protein ABFS83_13G070400 [Erythranthe nasuta]